MGGVYGHIGQPVYHKGGVKYTIGDNYILIETNNPS